MASNKDGKFCLAAVKIFPDSRYVRADRIAGEGFEVKVGLITVTGNRIPKGTKIRVECTPLHFDQEFVYDPQEQPKFLIEVEPGIDSNVVTTAKTPDGKWPSDANIDVRFYFAFDVAALSY
ncbi:hypothetical protein ABXS75_00635 [Roseburia hominis]